jgi:hypothetical protein
MSKAPPIPPEQRAFKGQKPAIESQADHDDLQSPDPGNADVNLKEQGRHGNLRQNTSHAGNVQDR